MENKTHWHDTDLYLDIKKVQCKEVSKGIYILTKSFCGLPKGFMFRDINTLEHCNA